MRHDINAHPWQWAFAYLFVRFITGLGGIITGLTQFALLITIIIALCYFAGTP